MKFIIRKWILAIQKLMEVKNIKNRELSLILLIDICWFIKKCAKSYANHYNVQTEMKI